MLRITNSGKGIYILEIFAEKSFKVNSKKFYGKIFKDGYYYYVGSAQKNLKSRIDRHLKREKKLHWHIDYITAIRTNTISNIYLFPDKDKDFECSLVQDLLKNTLLYTPVKDFGNSDCSICDSHLLYKKKRITYSHFSRLYHSIVRFIPSSKDTS
ncbi:hypothetical protein BMS3Abin04_02044 [bacterium BMS3Abin04]|nr:hypothetical protein BMS3Abin04_02044 [bacterium BMS3Abin04]